MAVHRLSYLYKWPVFCTDYDDLFLSALAKANGIIQFPYYKKQLQCQNNNKKTINQLLLILLYVVIATFNRNIKKIIAFKIIVRVSSRCKNLYFQYYLCIFKLRQLIGQVR